ncbi:MAG: hypothetical protein HC789_06955 [Microcoleus sp. CSU_2_2]|nr:hypothetical protein [Microcoleus sp. SU_5_3]NJS10130.1 hypothetical protein [Microcoleus sp. CSU_2_2]
MRRHQKSGSTTNNLRATHRTTKKTKRETKLVGCVATKNLEAPPTIFERRTAPPRGQREKLIP